MWGNEKGGRRCLLCTGRGHRNGPTAPSHPPPTPSLTTLHRTSPHLIATSPPHLPRPPYLNMNATPHVLSLQPPLPPPRSALGGMFGVVVLLLAVGDKAADGILSFYSPALNWIAKWLPLFYVASLVTLPLALKGIAGAAARRQGGGRLGWGGGGMVWGTAGAGEWVGG